MAYKGLQVSIPCGYGTFDANRNVSRVSVNNLILANNITDFGRVWEKQPGHTKFDANAVVGTPTISQGHDWWPTTTVQNLITYWNNGKVYKEVTGDVDSVTLATLGNTGNMGVFVEGGVEAAGSTRKLFLFTGNNPVQVLDSTGVVMTNLATPPVDWSGTNQPLGGLIHQNRLIGFGNPNFPHALYASSLTSHEVFTGADTYIFNIYPGIGERIMCAFPFIGRIYMGKYPFGLFWIDVNQITSPIVYLVKSDIGIPGPEAWARVGNDVVFLSAEGGIHSLVATQTTEHTEDSDISYQFNLKPWARDMIKRSRLDRARLRYFPERSQLWIGLTSAAGSINDTIIVLDNQDGEDGTPKIFIDNKAPSYEALFLRKESTGSIRPMGGGAGGFVWKLAEENRSVDGVAYNAQFQVPHTDLAFFNEKLKGLDKRFDWIEVIVTPTGNHQLSLDIYLDDVFIETVYVTLGSIGAIYGSAIYGTGIYGGGQIVNHKARLHGRGQEISIVGGNNVANQSFAVSEIILYFQASRMRGAR